LDADLALVNFADLQRICGAGILHSPVQIFSSYEFSIPSVLNLHDLQHLHFPENFSRGDLDARNRFYEFSADLSDAIITSSDFVRNDVITKMNVAARKVFTIPVTWNPEVIDGFEQFKTDDAAEQYKLPENFGFYPAQFWPHKNHINLVRALRIVRDRWPSLDFKIVFTGYRGHTGWPRVNQEMDRLKLHNHVVILDHIPVSHLAAIYKRARFCVVPSLFEASSYPVIEAQLLGCPSMCSDVTSLPELMKDGSGLLFDPRSPEDIADKMERWLADPRDAVEHAQRGRCRALAENSMENYADKLSKVYEFVLSEGKAIGL
jgi:glycosyltransferase involved in cell wall biosynthesis